MAFVNLEKRELVRLCLGIPVGYEFGEAMIHIGAARFTGNQHNEDWSWNKEYFDKMSEQELVDFYNKYKNK